MPVPELPPKPNAAQLARKERIEKYRG